MKQLIKILSEIQITPGLRIGQIYSLNFSKMNPSRGFDRWTDKVYKYEKIYKGGSGELYYLFTSWPAYSTKPVKTIVSVSSKNFYK